MTYEVRPATIDDAGGLLTVQLAAFVGEALLYDEFLPPLRETLDGMRAALADAYVLVLKVVDDGRLIGGGRIELSPDRTTGLIGRLCVAPDRQGEGIGAHLIAALEGAAPASVTSYAMFTGDRSTANLGLYHKLGYVEVGRRNVGTHDLIDLVKARITSAA